MGIDMYCIYIYIQLYIYNHIYIHMYITYVTEHPATYCRCNAMVSVPTSAPSFPPLTVMVPLGDDTQLVASGRSIQKTMENIGKSPILMGKSTISMAISPFYSWVNPLFRLGHLKHSKLLAM